MGCTAAWGRGEQDFISSAGNAPPAGGGLPFICGPRPIPRCGGPGVELLVPWVVGGELSPGSCCLCLAPSSLPSCGCAKGGGPQERCGSTQGTPVLLCLQKAGDTTHVGDTAGPGHAQLLSLPWGSQAPQVPGSPWQVCPLGICTCPDPCHRGCEKDLPGDAVRQGGGSACPSWESGVLPTSPRGCRAAPERLGVLGCLLGCWWARGAGS